LSTVWFEITPSAVANVPRATSAFVENVRATNASIDFRVVVGPSFWQVHERELAPSLIEETTRAVESWGTIDCPVHSEVSSGLEFRGADSHEQPVTFSCESETLVGMLHRGRREANLGVVIVVAGGPQYRVGAHRQFVDMARKLSRNGYPVLRFDLQGMGDSGGTYRGFQQSEADIRASIDELTARVTSLTRVVLIGECESASGILFYAWRDPRVRGVVLINPWVRTEEGRAQVIIKHYYRDRLRSSEFWRKVRAGRFDVVASLRSLRRETHAYFRGRRQMSASILKYDDDDITELPLPIKTAAGFSRFGGKVLLVMSGRDYISREFDEVTAASNAWTGLLDRPSVQRRDMHDADHTFSRRAWKEQASDWILEWLRDW
jgi:exosortase A-associated hydrolase 1